MDDAFFMQEALKEAQAAFEAQEVPVGAVLVYQGRIIARAANCVESMGDATCHAEICCMKEGARLLGNWRLLDTTLYCTLEPCAMCAGAMALFRIKRLVWGAPDLRHGAHGSLVNLLDLSHPTHQIEVIKGVCADASAALMRNFFYKRRQENGKVVR